jgi:hypothetical protein
MYPGPENASRRRNQLAPASTGTVACTSARLGWASRSKRHAGRRPAGSGCREDDRTMEGNVMGPVFQDAAACINIPRLWEIFHAIDQGAGAFSSHHAAAICSIRGRFPAHPIPMCPAGPDSPPVADCRSVPIVPSSAAIAEPPNSNRPRSPSPHGKARFTRRGMGSLRVQVARDAGRSPISPRRKLREGLGPDVTRRPSNKSRGKPSRTHSKRFGLGSGHKHLVPQRWRSRSASILCRSASGVCRLAVAAGRPSRPMRYTLVVWSKV